MGRKTEATDRIIKDIHVQQESDNRIAPLLLDPLVCRFVLSFECDGRQHPVSDVLALWIVEHFDVVEHVLSGVGAGSVGSPPDPFALQQIEETLGDRVVMAVTATAH